MEEPLIRRATEADLQKMANLYQNSFPEHIMIRRGILNNPAYLGQKISDPDQTWVVADGNGEIFGAAALAVAPPVGLGEIERVCVGHPFRGNGVAYAMCQNLMDKAKELDLGFIEAFARGTQPAMQRTFDKLGFKVVGVSPRFLVMHDDKEVREMFVHMGKVLKPETIDLGGMSLIGPARDAFNLQQEGYAPGNACKTCMNEILIR